MASIHSHPNTSGRPAPSPVFSRLKASCVPLLANSLLSPSSVPLVSKLLSELITTLKDAELSDGELAPNLVHYVFIPISAIIRRNPSSSIPDQVLEKLLLVLCILMEIWWWTVDLQTWEQIYILSGSIVIGLDKGKGRDRDEETREAAVQCLLRLLRGPLAGQGPEPDPRRETNLARLALHARSRQFFPIFGQTLTSVMETSLTTSLSLQRACLQALHVMIQDYAPPYFIPSILPGVVSTMTKAALGTSTRKGWSNGEIVVETLAVIEIVVVRAIGDDVCVEEGALRRVDDLQDLLELSTSTPTPVAGRSSGDTPPYATKRTESWLRASSSQLHIAMNSLSSLPSHPTPSALLALCNFSCAVLSATTLTLPQTQPLLLSYLLSLSNSPFPSVSENALSRLAELLRPGTKTYHPLMQTLSGMTSDYLSSLPRLISIQSEPKVEHTAGLIEAICRLCSRSPNGEERNPAISTRLQKLTGPMGGIEKWGWVLLSVLEFGEPEFSTADFSVGQILDVEYTGPVDVTFPELTLKNITSRSTSNSLVRMLRALGEATGEGCIFAIEWFIGVGRKSKRHEAIAALWCAARLLEGAGEVSLESSSGGIVRKRNKRVEKLARYVAKTISELWDEPREDEVTRPIQETQSEALVDAIDENALIEHKVGLLTIRAPGTSDPSQTKRSRPGSQPYLHAALSIQLLSISSGVLQARFSSLFLRVLYPILQSVVSTNTHLSSTALAGLKYITNSTSYASPANLLLANFDYALDAISRRLSRRWLDLDATKVLVLLVRLIGKDVVEKAGDVVEECFDRLDEYHGYQVLVEGLVEVLAEVVRIVGEDESFQVDRTNENPPPEPEPPTEDERFDGFFEWLEHRNDVLAPEGDEYGPAPREAWGKKEPSETDPMGETPTPVGDDPTPTATQSLTKQIVSRSVYFLTHSSPLIRARILTLLKNSVAVLPASAVLPSIHQAWPFVLNRFSDKEGWVVSAAAGLVESLSVNVGSFMQRRVWDDVWPKFRMLLDKLEEGDKSSALARGGYEGGIGTESAYTHSHRLYRSILRTVIAGVQKVRTEETTLFEITLLFRRFLGKGVHEELQKYAKELYMGIGKRNADAVWLVLKGTLGDIEEEEEEEVRTGWLEEKWDIRENAASVVSWIDR